MQQQLLREEHLAIIRALLREVVIPLSVFLCLQTRTSVRQTTEDVITTVQISFPATGAPVSLAILWTVMDTPAMVSCTH